MGGAVSKLVRSDDWPYVAAIRDPEVLDWKEFIKAETEVERRSEILRLQKLQFDLPVKISDGLYLSNADGATRIDRLRELGISHVLNLAGRAGSLTHDEAYENAGIQLLVIEAEDEENYPMLHNHLKKSECFIKEAKEGGGACLVHCLAGINRSGVIVAAYKMMSERMNVLDVVLHCRRQRGNVFLSTNEGFQRQLVALARREGLLGPTPTVLNRRCQTVVLLSH